MYAKCTLYSLGKNVIKLPSRVFAKMNFAKGSKNNAEFVKNKTMYATISRKISKMFAFFAKFPINLFREKLKNFRETISFLRWKPVTTCVKGPEL